ncbi:zinc finger protein 227-like [Spodoptera litura]|uniref:Zinc finger protein 227-like n=1 Tax=Spodoptera litura TaxID=69820 RepID=A0A9J7ECF9_SPOLT|nr:zinc finger protein 227-like [Spodoptera litura]
MQTRKKSCTGSSRPSTGASERTYSLELCRICLDDGDKPIFGENDLSHDIAEFGQIKIAKDDNLPQSICEPCLSLLKSAMLFRQNAKLSEDIMNKRKHEIFKCTKRTSYTDNESEDFERKNEEDIYIKTEYLEFEYSSDSSIDIGNFECKSEVFDEEDSISRNHTISEEHESEFVREYNTDTDNCDESLVEMNGKEADNEMIMIIVSDKDKQKLRKENKIEIDSGTKSQQSAHLSEKGNTNLKECEVCRELVSKLKYEDHLQEHRKKYVDTCNKRHVKVECKDCGKCVSKAYMKLHMRILHGTPEEQAERQIKCELCGRSFNRNYYADHVKRVHGINKNTDQEESKCITCPVCDKEIKESKYEAHVAGHGGRLKQFICDKCGKVFKHPSAFKTHCLTHGSELKYKCQFCPYRGLHQALLKIHVRTHTGDYNYKCTECPARFITKSNLSKHLQRHKAPNSFKCEVCSKYFYTKRDLEKHAKCVHLSLKTHVCDICGKGFGHRDNLLSHQLKMHKRDKSGRKGRMPSYLKVDLQNLDPS